MRVGMLRMLKRAASSCCSSVLTFPTCSLVARCCAVRSRVGAIIWQGPHQGAQKSTRTGKSLRPVCVANDVASSAMDRPDRISALHFGHLGCSPTRSVGVRTTEWHSGQATRIESDAGAALVFIVKLGAKLQLPKVGVGVRRFNLGSVDGNCAPLPGCPCAPMSAAQVRPIATHGISRLLQNSGRGSYRNGG